MKQLLLFFLLLSVGCVPNNHSIYDFDFVNVDSVLNIDGVLDSSNDVKQIQVPEINDFKSEIIGSLENVFDSLTAIKLETNDSCIIGRINQVVIVKDTIYIRDTWSSKSVFVFDMNGKYINSIGNIGSGPFEYVEPSDMYVTDSTIIIYDQWQHKLLTYNHRGDGLSDNRLPFVCNQFMFLENGDYLFRGINSDNYHIPQILDYGFWQTDSSFVISKVGLQVPHKKYISFYNNLDFWRQSTTPYFYNYQNDTVYGISESGLLYPKYSFVFRNNQSKSVLTNDKDFSSAINNGDYIAIPNIAIVGNIAVYELTSNSGPIWYVFQDLTNQNAVFFTGVNFGKSNLSRSIIMRSFVGSYKDYLLFTMPSAFLHQLSEHVKSVPDYWDNLSENHRLFDEFVLQNVNEEDNDVLILGLLKQQL